MTVGGSALLLSSMPDGACLPWCMTMPLPMPDWASHKPGIITQHVWHSHTCALQHWCGVSRRLVNRSGLRLTYWVDMPEGQSEAFSLNSWEESPLQVDPVEKPVILPDSQLQVSCTPLLCGACASASACARGVLPCVHHQPSQPALLLMHTCCDPCEGQAQVFPGRGMHAESSEHTGACGASPRENPA